MHARWMLGSCPPACKLVWSFTKLHASLAVFRTVWNYSCTINSPSNTISVAHKRNIVLAERVSITFVSYKLKIFQENTNLFWSEKFELNFELLNSKRPGLPSTNAGSGWLQLACHIEYMYCYYEHEHVQKKSITFVLHVTLQYLWQLWLKLNLVCNLHCILQIISIVPCTCQLINYVGRMKNGLV